MKKYRLCQTYPYGKGCLRIHGQYDSLFVAVWNFFKLNFKPSPVGKTYYYIEKQEDKCQQK